MLVRDNLVILFFSPVRYMVGSQYYLPTSVRVRLCKKDRTAMSGRYRNWCATINNYTREEFLYLSQPQENTRIKYMVFQQEVGKEGTPHLQCYLEMTNPASMRAVKKALGTDRVHLERRMAPSNITAIEYCKKAESREPETEPVEWGEPCPNKPGKRNDIEHVRQMIKDGASRVDVIESGANLAALKYGEYIRPYVIPPRSHNPVCVWIYGESGCGKSHLAYRIAGDAPCTMSDMQWPGTGYDGHQTVVVNNFEEDKIECGRFNEFLDKWPLWIAAKGKMKQLTARVYIITTVMPPQAHYAYSPKYAEFVRRLDEYVHPVHLDTHHSKRDDTVLVEELRAYIDTALEASDAEQRERQA